MPHDGRKNVYGHPRRNLILHCRPKKNGLRNFQDSFVRAQKTCWLNNLVTIFTPKIDLLSHGLLPNPVSHGGDNFGSFESPPSFQSFDTLPHCRAIENLSKWNNCPHCIDFSNASSVSSLGQGLWNNSWKKLLAKGFYPSLFFSFAGNPTGVCG